MTIDEDREYCLHVCAFVPTGDNREQLRKENAMMQGLCS